jgi:hypothetical protein
MGVVRHLEDHVLDTLAVLPIGHDVVEELERQIIDERLNLLGSIAVDASRSLPVSDRVARGPRGEGEVPLSDMLAAFPRPGNAEN